MHTTQHWIDSFLHHLQTERRLSANTCKHYQRDLDELHRFCNPDEGKYLDRGRKLIWTDDGQAMFTFGKYNNRTLQEVCALPDGRGYLEWILGKDFGEDLKAILREALDGVFPKREG